MIGPSGVVTLVAPGAEEHARVSLARVIAGSAPVVGLASKGVRNLRRRQTPAEIHALRRLLADVDDGVIGLLCTGRLLPAAGAPDGADPASHSVASSRGAPEAPEAPEALIVSDHVALTVPSPLVGPNEESLGPRFPVTAGLYRPDVCEAAMEGAASPGSGPLVVSRRGVVVCVRETGSSTALERELADAVGAAAFSAELAPVAFLAAHHGLGVAAVLIEEAEEA